MKSEEGSDSKHEMNYENTNVNVEGCIIAIINTNAC